MNLSWIDWAIVIVFMTALGGLSIWTRRYTKSVADFLAADRCAGRYLLTLSSGMAALGAASFVANFEKFYSAGFGASWWVQMLAPLGLIAALSGWVSYRYRETRSLTMAQFFEMRYSRRFRIFSGILCWVSGLINFGIFPALAARILIYFCGFPHEFQFIGLTLDTFPVLIAVELAVALFFTFNGGMISVMLTDFLQAQFTNIVFLIILIVLLMNFSFGDIFESLGNQPPGHSKLNPFDQASVKDFNWVFFAIAAFKIFYSRLAWQGGQGYNAAARSPHEAKMAGILAEWRNGVGVLTIMLMPVCAIVLMKNPHWAAHAEQVRTGLATIGDANIQRQMIVPLAMSTILPIGLLGLFATTVIAAAVSTDDTQLHSWGSIFVQDVIMPFRKRPFERKQHIFMLRAAIIGVAVFAFFWSWLVNVRENLYMYFFITGTIYMGGAGSVLIGGLYWRKGTTAGAYTAMIIGAVMGLGGMFLKTAPLGWFPWLEFARHAPWDYWLQGHLIGFFSYLVAIAGYVLVSIATCKVPHNMDKLLHKGAYAVVEKDGKVPTPVKGWAALGITPEFTRGDKFIFWFKTSWTLFFFVIFIIGTIGGLFGWISERVWGGYWCFQVGLTIVVGIATVIWFLIGGFRDMFKLFRDLKVERVDEGDDGWVEKE